MVHRKTSRLVAGMIMAGVLASGCGPEESTEAEEAPTPNTDVNEQDQNWEAAVPPPLSVGRQRTAYDEHGFIFEPNIVQRLEFAPLTLVEETAEDSNAEEEETDDPKVKEWQALTGEADRLYNEGKYAEAEEKDKEALAFAEKAFGPQHSLTASSLNNLASLYQAQGRFKKAEPLFKRALAIFEKADGPEHPLTAIALNNLASLYQDQGRYKEAEPLFKRALAIREKARDPEHPETATSLSNLARLYVAQGRFEEAEPLFKRALTIFEKVRGPEHRDTGASLNNLAGLYVAQGRFEEAEPLYRRALTIHEKARDPEHPETAIVLNNLAALYEAQGRFEEAEPLYERALAIWEKALGPQHPHTAIVRNNLAVLYRVQGRLKEAEPLFERALAIREKALGPQHPETAISLGSLAVLYRAQGRFEEAEPLYRRALIIFEKVLGPRHPETAISLDDLAELYWAQGRFKEAEPLVRRALAIFEKALGPQHPRTTESLINLGRVYHSQSRFTEALPLARRAMEGLTARFGEAETEGARAELRQVRGQFQLWVSVFYDARSVEGETVERLNREAFVPAQWARVSEAGAALRRMAARFAAGDEEVSGLVRRREDTLARLHFLDKAIIRQVSKPPNRRHAPTEEEWRQEMTEKTAELARIDEELKQRFPRYFDLISPAPAAVPELQPLLANDEALLAWAIGEEESFLFVLRRKGLQFLRLDPTKEEVAETVKTLRSAMNIKGAGRFDPPEFDLKIAHQLYTDVLAPALPHLEGVNHLILVPDGPLESLPFSLLATEAPEEGLGETKGYQQAAWLGKSYTLSTLPAVSALKALRREARPSQASRPLIGFGDPAGLKGKVTGPEKENVFRTGRGVDVEKLTALKPLPGTRRELRALARLLRADPRRDLYLGRRASEPLVRRLDKRGGLKEGRILAFATHGLTAGNLSAVGAAEPGLVLTPPPEASEENDGFLAASEIALLTLDAEWVILSACNTAASDGTPNAKPLSGLARAFLYAGSRALLVSHWYVSDRATEDLLKAAMAAWVKDTARGRAHALQTARAQLRRNPNTAHPNYWAPFALIGKR